jgi:molybdopterin converting factor small subunit
MARVVLTKGLTQFTGGESELELQVGTVRELLRTLGERYPALEPHPPDSEVYLIPQIAGG